MNAPQQHSKQTESLARLLPPSDLYDWLVTAGYFPESYVLPPCFHVSKHPQYGKRHFPYKKKSFKPSLSQPCELYFPKTSVTDLTFGIMEPNIHSDIAYEIASNWDDILDVIFAPNKHIYSYSFPIPVSTRTPGVIGGLRAGRMIYEWIEMAERDLVEEAYAYTHIVRSDIKNCYPSIYTHSIAWALHGKPFIRSSANRNDFNLFGNRLDKLFQNANDGCTNGIPIGPVVSDLIAEVILSAVDSRVSNELTKINTLALRFKDDYRFLCTKQDDCRKIIKSLQRQLKEFNLVLNEEKTDSFELPEGIFREWVSKYHTIRPQKNAKLTVKEFQELYLGVLRIDRENPGTGVIDRFIADIHDNQYSPLIPCNNADIDKIISLLLMLAERRIKSFPKILGIVEAMIISASSTSCASIVEGHLNTLLHKLCQDPEENRYLISWILYFLKSNKLTVKIKPPTDHPVPKSLSSNRGNLYPQATDFNLYRGIQASKKAGSLLKHLDVFKLQ